MTTVIVQIVTRTDGTVGVTVKTTVDGVDQPATTLNLSAAPPEPK